MFNTDELPWRVGNPADGSAQPVCAADRPRHRIAGTARLDADTGKYVYNGDLARKSRQNSFAAFVQDSWRVSPTLTVNGGLRWDVHLPFTPATARGRARRIEDICGISGIGNGPGGRPATCSSPACPAVSQSRPSTRSSPETPSHKTNWTDFAPNVGVAWRPDVQDGFLRTLLGDPEQATVRAGYALSYNQERIDRFTANAGNNPGGTITATRNN